MNARAYDLNPAAAKAADGGNYINETGKYVGVFTRAEAVTSNQKTDGIEFTFKANNGATADFLQLWTHREDGTELSALKTVNALMTCMKVKQIAPKPGQVEKYDQATKQRTKQNATVYPELQGKPIGILLQKVWRADKPDKYKFEIAGVFDAQTELTASEILDRATTPERLARMVAGLHDKHEKPRSGSAPAPAASNGGGGGNFGDFDDDIPFVSCDVGADPMLRNLFVQF